MNTTILPDGSAFSTAIIMSKEEAMNLPPNERPICYRISSEMYLAVWGHIGEATRCFNPQPPDSTFLPEKASDVVIRLCFKIAEELENKTCTDR